MNEILHDMIKPSLQQQFIARRFYMFTTQNLSSQRRTKKILHIVHTIERSVRVTQLRYAICMAELLTSISPCPTMVAWKSNSSFVVDLVAGNLMQNLIYISCKIFCYTYFKHFVKTTTSHASLYITIAYPSLKYSITKTLAEGMTQLFARNIAGSFKNDPWVTWT